MSPGSSGSCPSGVGRIPIGQTGNWTKTVLDDVLGPAIPTGRRYRIGIIEFQETPNGIGNKKLISNELEFLVLMNLDHVVPSSVHAGGTEVEVTTANELLPQGAKIVKFANQNRPDHPMGRVERNLQGQAADEGRQRDV